MSIISKSPYTDMDKSILYDEYASFMKTINSYSKETPFYVYSLCSPDGIPFYFGKGKGAREYAHLSLFVNCKSNEQPNGNWVRGMLQSEKKLAANKSNFNLGNRTCH